MVNKPKQKIKYLSVLFFIFVLLLVPALYNLNAADTETGLRKSGGFLEKAGRGAGFDVTKSEAEPIIGSIIKIFLSFLGIVFLILVIYGGFMWMTAQGNEQQVEKARKIIQNSAIGLIVIMFAYAITWFIVYQLSETTGFQK